jgi:hypothetical protein
MKWRLFISLFLVIVLYSCTTEQPCFNTAIQPSFIGFAPHETDTFILRRYKANSSFNLLIDSFRIYSTYYNTYQFAHDTVNVFVQAGKDSIPLFTGQIQVGYDWQVYIPSVNKTISISNIVDEKKTIKCHSGFPVMDKSVCNCQNPILYMKIDSLVYLYPDTIKNFRIYINR